MKEHPRLGWGNKVPGLVPKPKQPENLSLSSINQPRGQQPAGLRRHPPSSELEAGFQPKSTGLRLRLTIVFAIPTPSFRLRSDRYHRRSSMKSWTSLTRATGTLITKMPLRSLSTWWRGTPPPHTEPPKLGQSLQGTIVQGRLKRVVLFNYLFPGESSKCTTSARRYGKPDHRSVLQPNVNRQRRRHSGLNSNQQ